MIKEVEYMLLVKKLLFSVPFLVFLGLSVYNLIPLLSSYDSLFSLDPHQLITFVTLGAFMLLSGVFFSIFVALSADWKISLPLCVFASVIVFLISGSAVLGIGVLISQLLVFPFIYQTLRSYLTFNPSVLLAPSSKNLSKALALVFSIAFFLSVNTQILNKGFEIPDSLIDSALKFAPQLQETPTSSSNPTLPQIDPSQIELLKKNPELLKQYGLTPALLDEISSQTKNSSPLKVSKEEVKSLVKEQLQGMVKPYLTIIPEILGLLFFLILTSFISLEGTLAGLLISAIFYLLEKTGFVKFTTETREVKKLVV